MKELRALAWVGGFIKNNRYIFYAYSIVFAILLCVFVILKIYPFGDTTVLKSDSYMAYAPWVIDFVRDVRAGNNLAYTWNGGLGTGNIMNIGYFVPPFGFLVFLFPLSSITEFFSLIMLLRIPLAASTMFIYGRNRFGVGDRVVLLFSVIYALSQYPVVYHWDYFWQDLVIVLPLVALGIEQMFENRGWWLYCFSLSFCILTAYAQAFNLCVFAVLYFLAMTVTFAEGESVRSRYIRSQVLKKKFMRFLKFMKYSIIAGGMAMILVLPQLLAIPVMSNYGVESNPKLEFQINIFEYLTSHFWGNYPTNLHYSGSPPNIYTGVFPLILAVLFFASKRINVRDKKAFGYLLMFFFLCFEISWLTFIMHGLHMPSMLPHRYSVIYSFLIIVMALRVYNYAADFKEKQILKLTLGFIALMAVLYIFNWQDMEDPAPGYVSIAALVGNIALIAAYGFFLYRKRIFQDTEGKWGEARVSVLLLAVFILAESAINSYFQFNNMHGSSRNGLYNDMSADMTQISDYLSAEDDFYRAEFKHLKNESDGRLYNYKSFNIFGAVSGGMTSMLGAMGTNSGQNSVRWNNPTPVLQSIFAHKYLLHTPGLLSPLITTFNYKETVGSISIHENPDVLPLGFMVDDDMEKWTGEEEENAFENQDAMVSKAVGEKVDLFDPVLLEDFSYKDTKLEKTGTKNYGVTFDYDVPRTVDSGRVTLIYTAPESKRTYFSATGGDVSYAWVWVDDQLRLDQSGTRGICLDAGFVEAGSQIKVEIRLGTKKPGRRTKTPRAGELSVFGAQLDYDLFQECIETLREETMQVTSYDNTHIAATVTNEKKSLLFTSVVWDPGWKIKVDGEAVTQLKLGNSMTGLRLEPGTHTIEMEYSTRGVYRGAALTLLSVAAAVFIWQRDKREKEKNEKEGDTEELAEA